MLFIADAITALVEEGEGSMSSRLEQVYRKAERIVIDKGSRIVCMSDCHRGVGNRGDNFLPNRHLFMAALQYYYGRQFLYIELGDGDELWENKKLGRVVDAHDDVFRLISRFHYSGRFRMLYGNHDAQKKNARYFSENMCGEQQLFPGLSVEEGIVLVDRITRYQIFLVHGHQGDLLNDTFWPLAGLLVRFVWRPLEMLGIADPTSAARNYKKRKKTEERLDAFSREKDILLIAGHTHRPMLPQPGESLYLNDGSCVHPGNITAMELENGAITLVKWYITVRRDNILFVNREVMEGPIPWDAYWKE